MREEHLETSGKGPPALKKLFLTNLHWFSLGAAVLLVGLHFGGFLLTPPPGTRMVEQGIQTRFTAFRERAERAFLDKQKELEPFDRLLGKVRESYAPLKDMAPFPKRDVSHAAPVLALLEEGEPNAINFLPPRNLRLDVKRGAIELHWQEDGDNNVPVSFWEVSRSKGKGPWKKLAVVPVAKTSYLDRHVIAGVSYGYRVVAITDDASVANVARRSKPSKPRREVAAADVRLSLLGGDPKRGLATIRVEKWHAGAWWPRKFQVKVGAFIGSAIPGAKVAWATGQRLKSLSQAVKTVTERVAEVTFDDAGRVVLQAGRPVFEDVPVTQEYLVLTAQVDAGPEGLRTLTRREKR